MKACNTYSNYFERSMSNMSLVEIDFYSKIYFIAIKQKENKY